MTFSKIRQGIETTNEGGSWKIYQKGMTKKLVV